MNAHTKNVRTQDHDESENDRSASCATQTIAPLFTYMQAGSKVDTQAEVQSILHSKRIFSLAMQYGLMAIALVSWATLAVALKVLM
jgi:hypothetical protein